MSNKQYLDVSGARYLVQKVKGIINNKTYSFSDLTNKPTTIEGYGITDAIDESALSTLATKSELTGLASKNDLLNFVTKEEIEKLLNPAVVSSAEEIAAALTEAPAAIAIIEDLTVQDNIVIPADQEATLTINKDVTLNLGGKTIQVQGKLTIEGEGTITGTGAGSTVTILVTGEDAEVVIESGTIINTGNSAIEVQRGATLTVNGGEIQGQEFGILPRYSGSIVNINGGVIKTVDNVAVGNNGTLDTNRGDHGGTVINITGGRLESHITTPGYVACGVYMANHGVCNISGGEIVAIGGCGICLRAGTVNITGGFISGSGDSELLGKVGDSRVVVGPNGIIYDQSAHYPGITADAPDNGIHLNIYSGTITGKNAAIQVLKDNDFEADINVNGGLLMPPYEG